MNGDLTNSKTENFPTDLSPHPPQKRQVPDLFSRKILMGEKMTIYFLDETREREHTTEQPTALWYKVSHVQVFGLKEAQMDLNVPTSLAGEKNPNTNHQYTQASMGV